MRIGSEITVAIVDFRSAKDRPFAERKTTVVKAQTVSLRFIQDEFFFRATVPYPGKSAIECRPARLDFGGLDGKLQNSRPTVYPLVEPMESSAREKAARDLP